MPPESVNKMADKAFSCGEMRDRVTILQLVQEDGGCDWMSLRSGWANVTITGRKNLFSAVGIGSNGVQLILRRQALTLDNAIRWGDRHLFLTDIQPYNRLYLVVQAAVVNPVTCAAAPDGITFPGILTERYVRAQRELPATTETIGLVLVTPKAVQLPGGTVVSELDTEPPIQWRVQTVHTLDPHKNEYEIERSAEH